MITGSHDSFPIRQPYNPYIMEYINTANTSSRKFLRNYPMNPLNLTPENPVFERAPPILRLPSKLSVKTLASKYHTLLFHPSLRTLYKLN